MEMTKFKKLSFSHNRLTRISTLRKINFPNLTQLQLDHNYFKDNDKY